MRGPATRQPSLANGAMRLGESGGKVKEWWRQGRGHCRGGEVAVYQLYSRRKEAGVKGRISVRWGSERRK